MKTSMSSNDKAETGEAAAEREPEGDRGGIPASAPRSRRFRKLRHFYKSLRRSAVFFLGVLPLSAIVSRLPLSWGRALGRLAGTLVYLLARRERRLALDNLHHAFAGELSPEEIRVICRRVFQNAAVVPVEFLIVQRWPLEKIDRRFRLAAAFQDFNAACPEGTVGITAHFGNWELLALFHSRYIPGKLVAAARKHPNPWIQRSLDEQRRKIGGMEVFYSEESPRQLLRHLRERKLLGLLPDQNLRTPNGIFVPFFNRPAYTTTLPANLCRTTGSQMILSLLAREGSGFKLVFVPNLQADKTADRQADLEANTLAWTRRLEEEIRKRPDQWMWFHNRWRMQPGDKSRFAAPIWIRKRRR